MQCNSLISLKRNWNLHGLEAWCKAHNSALAKSLSTINFAWKDFENKLRASKIAINSASLDSLTPTLLENISRISPLEFRNNTSNTYWPQLARSNSVKIKLQTTRGRPIYHPLTFLFPKTKTTSQLNRMSFILMFSNSFLTKAHFATLRLTSIISLANEDEEHVKILQFLSFQMDQRIANGMILHNTSPHPRKGPHPQYWTSFGIALEKHQSNPNLLRKWYQTWEATSQWMKRWSMASWFCLHTMHTSEIF